MAKIINIVDFDAFLMSPRKLAPIFAAAAADVTAEIVACEAAHVAAGGQSHSAAELDYIVSETMDNFRLYISNNVHALLGGGDDHEVDKVRQAYVDNATAFDKHLASQMSSGTNLPLKEQSRNALIVRDKAIYTALCRHLAASL